MMGAGVNFFDGCGCGCDFATPDPHPPIAIPMQDASNATHRNADVSDKCIDRMFGFMVMLKFKGVPKFNAQRSLIWIQVLNFRKGYTRTVL
jgi:hypothetical protein